MGILVVGSVAFDSVKTPFGKREEILGGSAVYFSVAASYFAPVSLVAVVGADFPEANISFLQNKGIDTSGLVRQEGKTFRWRGEYGFDLNTAKTLETQLNVFADFSPRIPSSHRSPEYVFLGNIDPDLQRTVLEQIKRPKLVACDTMNYWIECKRQSLIRTLSLVDILLINEAEARQLTSESNLLKAAQQILTWGPKTLVIKRGEYGVLMFGTDRAFGTPAFPVAEVADPTGAGDSFAGGFMGFLAASREIDEQTLRKAVVFGSVMASFNISEFGPGGLADLTYPEIEARYREFRELTLFGDI